MEISRLVESQRSFFFTGASRTLEFRLEALRKLKAALLAHEDDVNAALLEDLGKQPAESYMCETGIVLEEIGYHLKHLPRLIRDRKVPTPLAHFKSRSFVSPEPLGVVLVMSPWNYPVQLCLVPLVGAISAGNCAVVKPSAYAPATSSIIARIISMTFPPEHIAVVEGGRQSNSALLEQAFDHIFFTGSIAVGKVVMRAASEHLTPVTLELGGKSPVIIDRSAKIELAARRIAFGKVLNAGQTCVAPDYMLVPRDMRDELVEAIRAELGRFFPGGAMSDLPKIVSQRHCERIRRLISTSGRIVIGGRCDPDRRFIEPTVLVNVDPSDPVMQEEIFGPVLPIIDCGSIDEAISFVRARPKPLALYLFCEDREVERRVLNGCSFGGGCVNDTVIQIATTNMPFGGVGESGMGAYHGERSFEVFSHMRSIVRKSTLLDLPMRYHPYTKRNLKLIKRFLK